jgi:hypothetical protein
VTRPTPLARLPPEQIGLVLTHPFQTSTIDVLVQLLSELRSLRTFAEYYEFQRKLFGAVFEADTRRAHARRQAMSGGLVMGGPAAGPGSISSWR